MLTCNNACNELMLPEQFVLRTCVGVFLGSIVFTSTKPLYLDFSSAEYYHEHVFTLLKRVPFDKKKTKARDWFLLSVRIIYYFSLPSNS